MDTRTNIVLDDELVAKAMAKAGVSTKKAAIDTALRAYVREPDWQGLLALAGSGVLADDYDPAQLFQGSATRLVASEPLVRYRAVRNAQGQRTVKAADKSAKSAKPDAAPRRK